MSDGSPPPTASAAPIPPSGAEAARHETRLAARNAVKLAISLVATLVVTVSVRFFIPRLLGPGAYGQVTWAESLAMMSFLVVTLGIDTYIAKEHAVEPARVEGFLGGLIVLRMALGVLAVLAMLVVMWLTGKDAALVPTVVLFGAYELSRLTCETLGGVLNAAGRVNRIALARPIVKLVWGAIVVGGMLAVPRIETVAVAFLIGELVRLVVYARIVRRELAIHFRIDVRAALTVVAASMGYFINMVIHRIYERIDVQMISVMAGDEETGFYGAAANLALAGLLFIPVVQSVILPMAARIATHDEDSMSAVMRLAVRIVLVLGVLPSLVLVLFREPIVALVFGDAYAPTASALGTLGFLFPLTYAAVILSLHLIQLEKIWVVTRISVVGLIINPTMNAVLIPWGVERFGVGGAGLGAGVATVVTELWVVVAALAVLGRHGVDRALVAALAKTALVAAVVVGLHRALPDLGLFRAPLEVLVFLAGVLLLRAVPREVVTGLAAAVRRRG